MKLFQDYEICIEKINDSEITIDFKKIDDDIPESIIKILEKNYMFIVENDEKNFLENIQLNIEKYLSLENQRNLNISEYLSEKLHYSYMHLSKVFSEKTHISIESFIILKRVEKVKKDLLTKNCTLTELAYKYGYSSVSHLSRQFKKNTGLTPSKFKEIVSKRKLQINNE